MRVRRRSRGFERSGSLPTAQLALSRRRARELEIGRAWTSVVGEAMARRVQVRSLRRGVVEIAIETTDAVEREAVERRLPRLTGRLAAAVPGLGIRRFRLCETAGGATPPSFPVLRIVREKAGEERPTVDAAEPRAVDGPPPEGATVDDAERLRRLMDRYLARRERQKP